MNEFVYGRHAVCHLIASGRRRPIRLYLRRGIEKSEPDLIRLAQERNIAVAYEDPTYFTKRFGNEIQHQGILLETGPYPYQELESLLDSSPLLILDEIQDSQNLGALCRSAYLFGAGGVVLTETHAASIGPGTCHASVGAVEYLKIARVSSISKTLEILKKNNFWTYGGDAGGTGLITEELFPAKVAVVIGNEEKGLRRLVRERCDTLLRIPMERTGIDSLNASVSGAIFLYEILRQNLKKP